MIIEEVIHTLENSYQLNEMGIREVIRPLKYVMPLTIGPLFHSLDKESNLTGTIISLKKLQEEYNNSSRLRKSFEALVGEYMKLQEYNAINPSLMQKRFWQSIIDRNLPV